MSAEKLNSLLFFFFFIKMHNHSNVGAKFSETKGIIRVFLILNFLIQMAFGCSDGELD